MIDGSADSIRFVHLGISLPHVGQYINVFGIRIAYYGIVIACAMLAGLYMAMWVARKTKQDPGKYFDFAMLAIVLSVIGARLYYVIFSWDYYSAHPMEILNVRGGGLAIYGGVITGIATGVIYAKIKHIPVMQLLDTACTGLILGQAIGRWGNFFNREAFGGYTNGLFAMQLPVEAVQRSDISAQAMENSILIDGVQYIQVHPTFLYESLWNIGVLVILLIVTLKIRKRFTGEVFLLYLLGYGSGRVWIEGLRSDQLLIPGTNLAVSQVLSAVIVAGALIAVLIMVVRNKKSKV